MDMESRSTLQPQQFETVPSRSSSTAVMAPLRKDIEDLGASPVSTVKTRYKDSSRKAARAATLQCTKSLGHGHLLQIVYLGDVPAIRGLINPTIRRFFDSTYSSLLLRTHEIHHCVMLVKIL